MRLFPVLALLLGILLFPLSPASAQQFYRWVDKDGKEFFTNDPKQVPQEYRDHVTTVTPDESRVSVGTKPGAPARSAAVTSSEHKDKYGRGEEYWRKKAANLSLKLRNQQDEYDMVLKQLEDQEHKPAKNVNGKKKKKSLSSLEKKKTKLEKDMARTRRDLEVNLPEEARRADAYPGWIRE